jgi:hypothetical protein
VWTGGDIKIMPSVNGGGNDHVSGIGFLSGDDGDDTLNGLDSGAQLDGGNGNDTLVGDIGNDNLDGGPDDDLLIGNDGNDTLLGGPGLHRLDASGDGTRHVPLVDDDGFRNPIGCPQTFNAHVLAGAKKKAIRRMKRFGVTLGVQVYGRHNLSANVFKSLTIR